MFSKSIFPPHEKSLSTKGQLPNFFTARDQSIIVIIIFLCLLVQTLPLRGQSSETSGIWEEVNSLAKPKANMPIGPSAFLFRGKDNFFLSFFFGGEQPRDG